MSSIEKLYKDQEDEKLQEFLSVMQPRNKAKTWGNDEKEIGESMSKSKVKAQLVVVPNKKPGGEGLIVTKTHLKFEEDDDDEAEEGSEKEKEENKLDMSVVFDKNLSDMDYLRSRIKSSEPSKEETEEKKPEPEPEPEKEEEEVQSPIDVIMDTGRLFIRNLTYTCTEEELKQHFEQFGPITEVHMPVSKETKKPVGYAYILFMLPEHAVEAYKSCDGKFFHGRLLHVLPGKEKLQKSEELDGPIKKKKAAKRKVNAGLDFNWNSLFMNADAVAESIASRLNISKADIFDKESDNQAVKLALAETQIISDAKSFFEEHGIDLTAFNNKERTDSIILVKNIPFGTTEQELRDLFGKFGELGRVLMPPSATIAIIEFIAAAEARAAFKSLAYSRFRSSLLYLEKAPASIISAQPIKSEAKESTLPNEDEDQGEESEDENESKTIFIKNLNFGTTEAKLQEFFSGIGPIRSVVVRKKDDPKNPGHKLSMGFGFIEFKTSQAAKKAVQGLQNVILEGHALQIKLSDKNKSEQKPKGKSSNKVIARNIAFEATKKELQELFSAHGHLKSIRLPKKYDGGHRGFAFLEFTTKQEAKNVMEAMSGTHLYGRHLVLEYAEDIDDLDSNRALVKKQLERDEAFSIRVAKRKKVQLEDPLSQEED